MNSRERFKEFAASKGYDIHKDWIAVPILREFWQASRKAALEEAKFVIVNYPTRDDALTRVNEMMVE